MRPVLTLLALLVASPLAAQPSTVDFEPRGEVQTGWTWQERASWKTTGHTLAKLGPVKVRDKTIDSWTSYACGVSVRAVDRAVASEIGVRCLDATVVDEGEAEDMPVTGIDVVGVGLGPEREFTDANGRKLKKKQRQFFARSFGEREPEQPDPINFLLPEGPVAVGQTWDLDLDAIQEFFGPDRFVMDKAQSHARVTLTELVERGGAQYGRLSFSTAIVPTSIKDGEFTEARMTLSGDALMPLRGDLPYRELTLDMGMRYVGSIKAKGVKVNLDLDTRTEGYEKKEPDA